MKLVIARETILHPLQLVAGVVEKRHTFPVLANILLRTQDNTLVMTGSDLEVELVGRAEIFELQQAGEITVPGKKLLDICRSLPEGAMIELALEGQQLFVRSGRARFTLSTLPANEFPAIDEFNAESSFSIGQANLRKIIDNCSFAMAQQDVRFYLNGMLFEVSAEMLRAVATDGHRLATAVIDLNGPSQTQQIILPRKGVIELAKLLTAADASVNVNFSANHLRAETEEFTFTSKLVDGKFPDYTRVIPRNGQNIVLADRVEMRQMLGRASILSNEKYRGVRFQLEQNLLKVLANNPEQEEAEESLEIDYQGDAMEMGFNVSYLQDVMAALSSEKIKITLSDANSSALLSDPAAENTLYVIMPMRL